MKNAWQNRASNIEMNCLWGNVTKLMTSKNNIILTVEWELEVVGTTVGIGTK